ncbi:hypothetical protein ACLOJK_006190 [Asimina triloba]
MGIPGNPFGGKCNYCKHEMKFGVVTRLRDHVAWMSSNAMNCPKVPKDVKTQMKEALQSNATNRRGRKNKEKEIAAKLGGFHYDIGGGGGGGGGENDEMQQIRHALKATRAEQLAREEEFRLERNRPAFRGSTREVWGGNTYGEFGEEIFKEKVES